MTIPDVDDDPYPYGTWVDGVRVGWLHGLCMKCQQPRTEKGHDPCIADMPMVKAACCGHGDPHAGRAYCAWDDGTTIYWVEKDGRYFEETECAINMEEGVRRLMNYNKEESK